MRKLMVLICLLSLFGGVAVAEVKGNDFLNVKQRRGDLQRELEGKELWRRMLGEERCLLLYIDEKNELRISFTDGPWVYMTDELVKRVELEGMELWEREKRE